MIGSGTSHRLGAEPKYRLVGKKTDRRFWCILHNMVARCHYECCPRFRDYGARGIFVCSEWYDKSSGRHNVRAFAEWCLSHGWRPGLQIDRIDNNSGYSPDNCRFVSAADNDRNRRDTILVKIGSETKCIKDWCASLGMNYHGVCDRISRGWSPSDAISTPLGDGRRYRIPRPSFHAETIRHNGKISRK